MAAKLWPPAAEPKTKLGYRRILSPNAGVRVSPLCLGGMSLTDAWGSFLGRITKDEAFALLDAFVEAGGNFIDTATNYGFGQSEEWIGDWMEARGNRDRMVIATKYTAASNGSMVDGEFVGNNVKSMDLAIKNSLKRLKTSYLDVLYLHVFDHTTSVEEVMRGLHKHVMAGRILYPAVSDTPAWVVVKANDFARNNGLSPFVLYQGRWACNYRDMERDIIPMCRDQGMGTAPWGSIGGGAFLTKAEIERRQKAGENLRKAERTEADDKICVVLEKIANDKGVSMTAIALAYCLQSTAYVFPIIGGRKIEHLHENIRALEITLTKDEIKQLQDAVPFDYGFPHSMISVDPAWTGESSNFIIGASAKTQYVLKDQAIKN